jgi:hypothetical protein
MTTHQDRFVPLFRPDLENEGPRKRIERPVWDLLAKNLTPQYKGKPVEVP